jgi:hypothetical protein
MLAPGEPGTVWESVDAEGTAPIGIAPSWNHGWSSGAAPALTNEVLGVTPASPGFASVSVAPHPSGLSWARGVVPTPQGAVAVSWSLGARRFRATVSSPVPGTFTLPVAGAATLDGKALPPAPGPVAFPAGSTTLVVTRARVGGSPAHLAAAAQPRRAIIAQR